MTSQPLLPELVRDTRLQAAIQGEFTVHTRQFGRRRHEKWVRKNILGHGGCGIVWLEHRVKDDTQEEDPGESRAVKRIDTSGHRSEHYVRELEALAKFSQDKYSDFFVKFFGWYDSPGYLYIAMEYCEHGDLKKYLADNDHVLPESQVQEIISQVLAGLAMMHEAGFANRDVKPANILIKSKPPNSWWVKVCDMGLSKRTEDAVASTTVRGTPGFMPPELHGFYGDPKTANPFMADMWCLGETAFQALTGRPVFNVFTDLGRYQSGALPFPEDALRWTQAGPAAVDFIRSLMRVHPWERLDALRATEHPWVRPAPDPLFHSHNPTQPMGPPLSGGPLWQPQFPWAPGDQLTQASGQWTVTMPYPNQNLKLPRNAPPAGIWEPMQAHGFASPLRGNPSSYGPAQAAHPEYSGLFYPLQNQSPEPYLHLPVPPYYRSSVSHMEPQIPPAPVPSLSQRNSMPGPGVWGPPPPRSIFAVNGSSTALPSRGRATTSTESRAAPSPSRQQPPAGQPPGQPPADTEPSKPFTDKRDELSIPTPVVYIPPKLCVRPSDEPEAKSEVASTPTQGGTRNTSENSSDTRAPPSFSATEETKDDVLKSFKAFATKHRAEAEARRVKQAAAEKQTKLNALKEFGNTFQLTTPIPKDLVRIIAKTPEKQAEITKRQNDVLAQQRAKEANREAGDKAV